MQRGNWCYRYQEAGCEDTFILTALVTLQFTQPMFEALALGTGTTKDQHYGLTSAQCSEVEEHNQLPVTETELSNPSRGKGDWFRPANVDWVR